MVRISKTEEEITSMNIPLRRGCTYQIINHTLFALQNDFEVGYWDQWRKLWIVDLILVDEQLSKQQ